MKTESAMKQILLLVALFISISAFTQSNEVNSPELNDFSNRKFEQPELKLYPNPCTDQKITIELNNDELTEIRITNITGKMVVLKKFTNPIDKIQLVLNNIPDGIYLVQIKSAEDKIVAKKLVVSGN